MNIKIRRLVASLIDFYTLTLLVFIPLKLINSIFHGFIINILIGIVFSILVIYIFINKDCIIGYESIGKKIMHLKIYQNGIALKNKDILKKRSSKTLWSFPFYPIMVLINNQSEGDIAYHTEVKVLEEKI